MSRHFLRYLTALGASALGGQWGSWQLTDSPEAPSTASWRLNFMSADWRTMRISADGNLSAIAKPMEILGTNQWRTQKPLVITSCPCQYMVFVQMCAPTMEVYTQRSCSMFLDYSEQIDDMIGACFEVVLPNYTGSLSSMVVLFWSLS